MTLCKAWSWNQVTYEGDRSDVSSSWEKGNEEEMNLFGIIKLQWSVRELKILYSTDTQRNWRIHLQSSSHQSYIIWDLPHLFSTTSTAVAAWDLSSVLANCFSKFEASTWVFPFIIDSILGTFECVVPSKILSISSNVNPFVYKTHQPEDSLPKCVGLKMTYLNPEDSDKDNVENIPSCVDHIHLPTDVCNTNGHNKDKHQAMTHISYDPRKINRKRERVTYARAFKESWVKANPLALIE